MIGGRGLDQFGAEHKRTNRGCNCSDVHVEERVP